MRITDWKFRQSRVGDEGGWHKELLAIPKIKGRRVRISGMEGRYYLSIVEKDGTWWSPPIEFKGPIPTIDEAKVKAEELARYLEEI